MSIQVQNHWFFSCLTVVFWLNYSSVPWIHLADITRFRTRMKFMNWTFKVVLLFSYQVAVLLSHAKAFIYYHNQMFLSRTIFLFFKFSNQIFQQSCRATCLYYHIQKMLSSKIIKNLQKILSLKSRILKRIRGRTIPYRNENQSRYSYKLSVRNIGLICLR